MRRRNRLQRAAALTALTTAAAAFGGAAFAQPDPSWTKTAYARVDGIAILRTAVDADVAKGWPKDRALQRAITNAVMTRNLLREGFDPAKVTKAELTEMLDETRTRMKASGVELEQALTQSGQTLRQFKSTLRIPVCFRKLLRASLTEDRLKQLYREQALALRGEVRASHILIKIDAKRKAPAARAKAVDLLAKLGKAPTAASFAEVAQTASEDPLAPLTGGDLDWFRAGSREVPPSVGRAAFGRGKAGLIQEPIRGRRGFHIVLVTGTRMPKGASYEQLRDELRQRAERVAASRTMQAWMKAAKIELAPDAPRPKPSRKPGR